MVGEYRQFSFLGNSRTGQGQDGRQAVKDSVTADNVR